jgi:tRNA threonylcarbamoyladenosine biosynthesis protein TsaE
VTPITTNSEVETIAAGRDLGRRLAAGDVILLEGPLGAGKTAFARGLAEGLGCDTDAVASPTFTIVHEYPGRLPLQHVDLYRLTAAEVDDLGLEDLMEGQVLAVEWPDRWRHAPAHARLVTIEPAGGDRRLIRMADYSTR